MKAKLYFTLATLFMVTLLTSGQQLPEYTLYNNNLLLLNPAYAGVTDNISLTAGYRKQWAGFEGTPGIFSFSGHGYLDKYNVGVGLSGWQFEAGAFKQTALFSTYSYRLKFEKFALNLGLQGGIINYRTNYAMANLNGVSDPLFNNDVNQTNFNTGGGAFLYADKFYVGFSAPVLITYKNNEKAQVKMDQHFMLMGGYLFDLNEKLVVKPHGLVKIEPRSPISYNLGATAYYAERVGLGIMYKSQQMMALTFDVNFNRSFYLAYGYDLRGGSDIGAVQNGSHEITINYLLPIKGNQINKVRYY